MEHRIGSYLVERYGTRQQGRTPTYDATRTRALFIIETRTSYWLPLVIRNAVDMHPDWNLYVAGTDDVLAFVAHAVGGEFKSVRLDMPPRISTDVYSAILTNADLWDAFQETHVLVFQTDAAIFRPVPAWAEAFDCIGASCGNLTEDEFVINGGLCLRRVDAFRKACALLTDADREFPEDVAFCRVLRRTPGSSLPTIRQCNEFAVESHGHPQKAIGIHGADKYYAPNALIAAMVPTTPKRVIVDAFVYDGQDDDAVKTRLALLGGIVSRFVVASSLPQQREKDCFARCGKDRASITWIVTAPEKTLDAITEFEFDDDAIVAVSNANELPNPAVLVDLARSPVQGRIRLQGSGGFVACGAASFTEAPPSQWKDLPCIELPGGGWRWDDVRDVEWIKQLYA